MEIQGDTMLLKTKLRRGGRSLSRNRIFCWVGGRGEAGSGQEIKIATVATQEMVLASLLKA